MAGARYFLTPGAAQDIREIGDWSLHRWGRDRTVRYLTDLHEGLEFVAANFKTFETSKTREGLAGGSGLLLYAVNKHYAVIAPLGDTAIAVAAVIRRGRDIPANLQKGELVIWRDLQDIRERIAAGLIGPPADGS